MAKAKKSKKIMKVKAKIKKLKPKKAIISAKKPVKQRVKEEKVKVFTEVESEKIVAKYINVAKSKLCKSFKDCEAISKAFGFPLVLKIISKDAIHKTEINGVRVVKAKEDLEKTFNDLISIAKKKKLRLDGILVQEYLEGQELIIGIKKDETFGHVIAAGVGGIFTELLKDVTFRVCPIDEKEAAVMVDELKAKKVLEGYRNIAGINLNALYKALARVSEIPMKYKNIKEMDINPFIINEKNGKVADARIVMGL